MTDLYFDDFAVGQRFTTHGITLTESLIIDFAMRYDPQPFHIDVEAAKASNFGGLIASGFQTIALGFRMVLETGV
ncbi:MAG TPA: MaoC/PaaZ C-terminal domain-containing protein, partial [Stellaceae bacterium]|nr:MaoC/PaaZ C-terminal domain-containing protein [Stellaceae bacterium]